MEAPWSIPKVLTGCIPRDLVNDCRSAWSVRLQEQEVRIRYWKDVLHLQMGEILTNRCDLREKWMHHRNRVCEMLKSELREYGHNYHELKYLIKLFDL
jgi:hypothetical protein